MKSWYITGYTPDIVGGYETDAISEYAQSDFTDILETSYSDEAILLSPDLKEQKTIRCVIQGNTADTALNSMNRIILVPIGTVKCGMYLYFENSYWIIDGRPGNNKSYEKVTVKLCQYILRWQTRNGKIHERPINITSASKYDVGESGGKNVILTTNNYTILIGYDEDSLELDAMRVFIDKRTDNPTRVFKFTRTDDVLYDFGKQGSVLAFIADKTEFNKDTDNQELRICDYIKTINANSDSTTSQEEPQYVVALTGTLALKIGRKKTWTATVIDKNGNKQDFTWNVITDFDVEQTPNGNSISLECDNEDVIGEFIQLQILVNGNVVDKFNIEIEEAW